MISKQAEAFWTLLKSFPKQIEMPLSQARDSDLLAEFPTSEPTGVAFSPADVDGLWAEVPGEDSGRAILYFFGGGYLVGTPATRRKTAGHLALAAGARVLVPNYRLAPEHPFPAAVEDAVQAWQWLVDQGAEPSRTFLAGDSAGGGLAVATAIALRDRRLPMCGGIVAISPWADLTCSGESMTSRAVVDIECTRAGLLDMAGTYLHGADPAQPLASPVLADLTGLPPLLCLVGGDEVLLDDSARLVRNAGIAGIDATLSITAGMQHVFPIWAGAFPEADAAIRLIGDWVRARAAKVATKDLAQR
ncbi:MAG: alpha/beta hydrolase [Chthoniobacterales bacterium]|nr:alpha/beta hydrolase [Chthoniobacterales bacterium]